MACNSWRWKAANQSKDWVHKKKSHDTLIPANPNIPTVQSAELHLKFNVSVTSGDHDCMGGCKSLLALLPAGIVKLVGGWVEGS